LRLAAPEAQCHDGMPPLDTLEQGFYRVILDPLISASDIHTQLHALVRMAAGCGAATVSYSPVRFVPHEKLAPSDKLLVAFDALAVSRVTGHIPRVGKIVHGSRYVSATVPLSRLSGKAQSFLTKLATSRGNATPPPLVLNKHCPACQFRSRCRQSALEEDDLSLLPNISEKDRGKLNNKGIFTVAQLSYTFRPRRPSFRKNSRPLRHDPALKGLAIREKQIHVIGTPTFSVPESAVYIDVEGIPDHNFYCLIGLRYKSDCAWVHRSFWADTEADEKQTWASFLHALALLGNPQLVHYGSYETQFLKRMKTRYPDAAADEDGFLDRLISSSRNLLSLTYAQVYFPTYSNGLKDIAGHLGFRWSDDAASGLHALVWRSQWESSQKPSLKRRLLTYDAEDCEAVQHVAEALAKVCLPRMETQTPTVEFVDAHLLLDKYKRMFRPLNCAVPSFKQINDASYWDYQRSKVYVRCSPRIRHLIHQTQKRSLGRPKESRVNKVLDVSDPRPPQCSQCGSNLIHRHERRTQITSDIRFSASGPRRQVLMYSYYVYRRRTCNKSFNQYERRAKYGAGLCAYVAYLLLEMKISQGKACEHLREVFLIHVSGRGLNKIKAGVAEQSRFTYEGLLEKIAKCKLVHADETKVTVAGESRYVWVFTNLEKVAFVYGGSREAGTDRPLLGGPGVMLVQRGPLHHG
jgi:predicted RecB family nuclease